MTTIWVYLDHPLMLLALDRLLSWHNIYSAEYESYKMGIDVYIDVFYPFADNLIWDLEDSGFWIMEVWE